jgi:hypothetical protein
MGSNKPFIHQRIQSSLTNLEPFSHGGIFLGIVRLVTGELEQC